MKLFVAICLPLHLPLLSLYSNCLLLSLICSIKKFALIVGGFDETDDKTKWENFETENVQTLYYLAQVSK